MHNAVWLTKIKAHSTQTKVATEAENHKHSSGTKLGNLTSTFEKWEFRVHVCELSVS